MKILAILSIFVFPALFVFGLDFKPQRDCQEELNAVYRDNDSLRLLLRNLQENLKKFSEIPGIPGVPFNPYPSTATPPTDKGFYRVTYTYYGGRLGIQRMKPFLGIGPSAGVYLNDEGSLRTYLGVGVNFNIFSLH